MDLHEVDPVRVQPAQRLFHLVDAGFPPLGTHLGGQEEIIPVADGVDELPDHDLRPPVGRGRVHHSTTHHREGRQHLLEHGHFLGRFLDVISARGSDPDRRNLLAGGWDRAHEEL